MKKIISLSLVILTFVFISCTSREKKAQKLIQDYLAANLNDASSYEAVEFSKFDSLFSPYFNTAEGKDLWEKAGITGTFHKRAHELKIAVIYENDPEKISLYEDSIKIYEQLGDEYETKYNEKEKEYKGDFIGLSMTHKYRAKNKLGAFVLKSHTFDFDKEITKITNTDFE